MKKAFSILLCLVLLLGLAACGSREDSSTKEYTYEIALITPSSEKSINDGGYVENTWKGVRAFAEEKGKTYRYYEPKEESEEAVLEAVNAAVSAKSKVIVGYGSAAGKAFEKAAKEHSEQAFLLIGESFDTDYPEISLSIDFSNAEAGYLAGYAAVTEGYETIGFLAEEDSPETKDYVYGFMQGCQTAATQWGHFVDIQVSYDGAKGQQTAKAWYEAGTEVIAVYGDETLTKSAEKEAEKLNRKVFAAGVFEVNETVTASAVIDCSRAAGDLLERAYRENGDKQVQIEAGADSGYIRLDWNAEEFALFLQEDYEKILEKMNEKNFRLKHHTDAGSEKELIQKANLYKISLL